ncbi:MAG: helix-turn-helix domain-containing protein [Ruminococcus flavefaciens]|nr:helix-turn-helix domain-containing protein [Ruminococcus flavefaciens]
MFYERFLQICEQNNEKPTQVLKAIGASSGNLSNWKNGGAVKSDILLQLSKHFNVSTDYLLGKEELKTVPIDPMTQILIAHFSKLSPQDKIDFLNEVVKKTG